MNKRENKIDVKKLIEDLATIQCPVEEICSIVDLSIMDIRRRYGKILSKGYEKGKMSLRRAQWESAMQGSVPMQMWLGKVLLGQSENKQVETCLPEVRKLVSMWENVDDRCEQAELVDNQ